MAASGGEIDREALRREALRVHRRYAEEVVEAFGFCPWAAPARARGRVHTRIVFGAEADLERTLYEVECLERDESAEIGLLAFPECVLPRVAFQHFAARVRERCERRHGVGRSVFAIADFHPQAEPDLGSPERLVAFIRRSPDPTLQLLRRATLDEIRRGEQPGTRFVDPALLAEVDLRRPPAPPLHQRIAEANMATVQRLGVERVAAVIGEIIADRDRSYRALGLDLPTWSTDANAR